MFKFEKNSSGGQANDVAPCSSEVRQISPNCCQGIDTSGFMLGKAGRLASLSETCLIEKPK